MFLATIMAAGESFHVGVGVSPGATSNNTSTKQLSHLLSALPIYAFTCILTNVLKIIYFRQSSIQEPSCCRVERHSNGEDIL